MKRIVNLYSVISVLALLVVISSCSNKALVNNAVRWAEEGVKLDTALKSVNAAEELEDTKDWAKTYYAKGLVYDAISQSSDEEFKTLSEEPLVKAFENYKKAYNMEGGNIYQGPIDAKMITLVNQFINEGVEAYNAEDYAAANTYFEKSLEIKEMPVFAGEVDTAVVFNVAITAEYSEDHEEAIKYYKQCIDYDYEPITCYRRIKNNYFALGDTLKGITALKEGINQFPESKALLIDLTNYYLVDADDPEQAIEYLQKAQEQDPKNAQLFATEGSIYDRMGKQEKAISLYERAIELDPEAFLPYYNMGVIYFNQGVELADKAGMTRDDNEYLKLKKEADEKFQKALPFLEKASEISPNDKSLLNTLKTLYYRLKMNDKYQEVLERMSE